LRERRSSHRERHPRAPARAAARVFVNVASLAVFSATPSTLAYTALMGRSSDLSGIAAMLTATAFLVVGDSFMKLVTEDLPPFEVLFLRGIAASLACAVLLALRGEWHAISGVLDYRAMLRAAADTLSTLCYVVALARLPIADVIAIEQTAPLILILGAAFLLRERVGSARLALVLVGFTGAIMVAQPGPTGVSPAALLAFAAALMLAVRDLVGRSVPTSIPVMVVALASMIMVTVTAGAMSLGLETWVAPTGRHLAFLGFAGLFLTFGQAGILLAYRLGRISTVAPILLQLRALGGRLWPHRLGRIAERSGPRRDCPDRRERHRHCRARSATWPRGDRADRCVMSTL
jgi:drug/metabolite transporter (DMT)-like permease